MADGLSLQAQLSVNTEVAEYGDVEVTCWPLSCVVL